MSLELWEGAMTAESGLEIWQVLARQAAFHLWGQRGPEREPPLGVYFV